MSALTLFPDDDPIGAPALPPFVATSTTSREAALAFMPKAGTARRAVYDWLAAHGPATDEEVQAGLGMAPNTERPRRVELVRGGWVADTGLRISVRGLRQVLWAVAR